MLERKKNGALAREFYGFLLSSTKLRKIVKDNDKFSAYGNILNAFFFYFFEKITSARCSARTLAQKLKYYFFFLNDLTLTVRSV